MFCPHCGSPLNDSPRFCPYCGFSLTDSPSADQSNLQTNNMLNMQQVPGTANSSTTSQSSTTSRKASSYIPKMKKPINTKLFLAVLGIIVVAILLLLISSGRDKPRKGSGEEYQVYLDITLGNDLLDPVYDVDVSLDGEPIATIKNGTGISQLIKLNEGKHTLSFSRFPEGNNTSSKSFTVKGDMTITVSLKSGKNSIRISLAGEDGVKKSNLKIPDVVGKNLKEAKADLSEDGFVNIKAETYNDADIWEEANWTVIAQTPAAGEKGNHRVEIILRCEKPGYEYPDETAEETEPSTTAEPETTEEQTQESAAITEEEATTQEEATTALADATAEHTTEEPTTPEPPTTEAVITEPSTEVATTSVPAPEATTQATFSPEAILGIMMATSPYPGARFTQSSETFNVEIPIEGMQALISVAKNEPSIKAVWDELMETMRALSQDYKSGIDDAGLSSYHVTVRLYSAEDPNMTYGIFTDGVTVYDIVNKP